MPTALPAATAFTDSAVTEGSFKTQLTNLRAFLAEMLGTVGGGAQTLTVAAAGTATISAAGPDADHGLTITTKGAGTLSFATGGGTQFQVIQVASANRALTARGANSGNPLLSTTAGSLGLSSAGNNPALLVTAVASNVNNVSVNGKATGGYPEISTTNSSDATCGLDVITKNTGPLRVYPNGAAAAPMLTVEAASGASVNHVVITNALSGANASIKTNGENLLLGAGSALATSATAGHIMIPSCAGTPSGAVTGAGAGAIPLIYDSTANKIWARSGGTWRQTAALT